MSNIELSKIFKEIDDNSEKHTQRLQEFLKQPSVASEDRGMVECAELLLKYMEELGFVELELMETDRHPVACGRYDADAENTLILHGMYDTAPVGDEEKWRTPPYKAEISNIDELGQCIVAPGALRKSPNALIINAIESILKVEDTLPVNVVFNIEGEHGLMSPNYPQFYEKYKDKISDADAVFWPMLSQELTGEISVKIGHKGMMGFQLVCDAKEWGRGPQERALHSADCSIVDNPTWRLINALSTMTERDGKEITIDGYYDDIVEPDQKEIELLETVLKDFDEEALKKEWMINNFVYDLTGKELLMRHLFGPVFCIGNIYGGTPRPAPYPTSKVDVHIRLVPEQTVNGILKQVREHLNNRGYHEINIIPQYGVPWIKNSMEEPIVKATVKSYDEFNAIYVLHPFGTKTPPTGVYKLPYMDGGLGYGRRGLNELMIIDKNEKVANLPEIEKYYVSLLYNFRKYN